MKISSSGKLCRWALLTVPGLAACSGEDAVIVTQARPSAGAPPDDVAASPEASTPNGAPPDDVAASPEASTPSPSEPASRAPLYVIANEVFDAEGSTSYVNVLTSLDIQALDYGRAIEFSGGRATIQTYAGWLYVAGPESPVIARYGVNADGTLAPSGEVSFGNYAFESVVIDDWSVTFIAPHKAYLVNASDGSTLIWDPTDMVILGEVDPGGHSLARPAPLTLNFSPGAVRGNRLFRTVSWDDWDAGKYSVEQYLAIYDLDADRLIELIPETRCPSLGNRVAQNETGDFYFSNWIWNVGETLLGGGPKSCALRLDAGSDRLNSDWVLPYASLTEGREAAMFTYLAQGRGLLSVFHSENVSLDANLAPDELMATNNWRVWGLDVDAQRAAPLSGLDWMAGAASTFQVGGRTLMLVPADDWSITHVYEIASEGATPRFDINGWSFQLLEIR